jgi:hypothetical protein
MAEKPESPEGVEKEETAKIKTFSVNQLSLEQRKALKTQAELEIDQFMRKVGIKDPASLTDEEGWRHFKLGSADGRAGIIENEDSFSLRVEAYLMELPSDKELILPLMRELLNINSYLPGELKIGLIGDIVCSQVHVPLGNIENTDFGRLIHMVMSFTDNIDEQLLKKYSGTSRTRKETEM